jgi:hypothetical protein
MVTNATARQTEGAIEPMHAWHAVVRVATGASLVAIAAAYALHTFAHVSDGIIVALVAVGGLLLGRRLPAVELPHMHLLFDEESAA